jgi:hypothetical protein
MQRPFNFDPALTMPRHAAKFGWIVMSGFNRTACMWLLIQSTFERVNQGDFVRV